MGSLPTNLNVLEYVRSKMSNAVAKSLGPFVGCTSNQIDAFYELQKPARANVLKKSIELASLWHDQYPKLAFEQLAFDIGMVKLSLSMAPFILGALHIMANPMNQTSTGEIVANGQRIVSLAHRLDPSLDLSRLVIKVVSTWEGLQACRQLESAGIKTNATTLFTFEQAVLAAEVGCHYVSPFLHELKALLDETYVDCGASYDLCLKIQDYYEQQSCSTKVKVAGLKSTDEAFLLTGAQTMTIPPDLLKDLSQIEASEESLANQSLYVKGANKEQTHVAISYINEEVKWRAALEKSDLGKGAWKTVQAIELFTEHQVSAEKLLLEHSKAPTA